ARPRPAGRIVALRAASRPRPALGRGPAGRRRRVPDRVLLGRSRTELHAHDARSRHVSRARRGPRPAQGPIPRWRNGGAAMTTLRKAARDVLIVAGSPLVMWVASFGFVLAQARYIGPARAGDLIAVTMAFVVAAIVNVGVLLYGMRFAPRAWPRVQLDEVIRLFRGAIPLGMVWITTTFYFGVDMVMLQRMAPAENVGWYAAAYRLFNAASIVPTIVAGTVLYP